MQGEKDKGQDQVDLKVKISSDLILRNPIMNSSGMFMYGTEVKNVISLKDLGVIIVKGISLKEKNIKKEYNLERVNRIVEIKKNYSYLNAVGFENIGIEAFLENKFKDLKEYDTPVFINCLLKDESEQDRDIFEIIKKISEYDDKKIKIGLELNPSCPNLQSVPLIYNPKKLLKKLKEIKKESPYPIIVKSAPSIENIETIAKTIEDSGADAISLINTIPGMVIDIEKRKSALWRVSGGLSGPCIHPIALKMVHDVYKSVKIPIIGIGGIHDGNTAIAMFIAGASAIQIGTAFSFDTKLGNTILKELKSYCQKHSLKSIKDLVGTFQSD